MEILPDGSARLRRNINLAPCRSLQELQFHASTLIPTYHDLDLEVIKDTFRNVLVGIRAPPFSNVVIVYGPSAFYSRLPAHRWAGSEVGWYHRHFEIFRAMHETRRYKLVLVAKKVDDILLQELERAVAVEQEVGGLPSRIEIIHIPEGTDEIKYTVGPISLFSFETR